MPNSCKMLTDLIVALLKTNYLTFLNAGISDTGCDL